MTVSDEVEVALAIGSQRRIVSVIRHGLINPAA